MNLPAHAPLEEATKVYNENNCFLNNSLVGRKEPLPIS
jgi:hypothetical protein